MANIIPIFKRGLSSDPNYIGQSRLPVYYLLSVACHVMERKIKDVILKYLHSYKPINRFEHGGLYRILTFSQLLECTHDWTIRLVNRTVTDCVYVDFKRAFDVTSHQKLTTKLIIE